MTEHEYTRATRATCGYAPCMETFIVREGSPQCYGYCSDACLEASGAMSRESLARAFDVGMCADEPVEPPRKLYHYFQGAAAGANPAGRSEILLRPGQNRGHPPLIRGGQGRTDDPLSDCTFRRWQFCTRFDIPDRQDPSKVYLTRWRIVQTPWFGIYLHRINLHDSDEHPHDHPWPFVSIVLRGGYDEERVAIILTRDGKTHTGTVTERRGWLSVGFRRATDFHRILRLFRAPTWTLVLVGRRQRTWGFLTDCGWVRWTDYFRRTGP